MLVKWKVNGWAQSEDLSINRVECTRATDRSVWAMENTAGWGRPPKMEERRRVKGSDYHDTWEAAHAFLIERAERKLQHARATLQRAQKHYGNAKGMKKPPEPHEVPAEAERA